MMPGVKLPVRNEDLPISREDYMRRFNAYLDEKGRHNPKYGFMGNWNRYIVLEERFRELLKAEFDESL